MNSEQCNLLFAALAHPARRQMLDLVQAAPGMTIKALTSHFPELSRVMVLKHIRALEACELLLSKKEGRSRLLFFNPIPIQVIYDRWTDRYAAFWSGRMADLKDRVESRQSNKEGRSA